MGTEYPHLLHILLEKELEIVSKLLFVGCVPTPFLLTLHPWPKLFSTKLYAHEVFGSRELRAIF